MPHRSPRRFSIPLVLLIFAALLAGCGEESVETAPPGEWQADGARWWRPGADTARAFRDLSEVDQMGVVDTATVLNLSTTPTDEQVAQAAKGELVKLYRKNPEIIDSLFAEYVAPMVPDVPRSGNMTEHMRTFGEEGSAVIREHFQSPTDLTTLGTDVPLGYPDSLFERGVTGRVRMQVYLNAEGQPQAIKLIDGLHPVLDDTARRAVAQARWEPARVRQGQYGWREIPAWTWVSVRFG